MENILKATSANRQYVEDCTGRMETLSRSARMLGLDKLAEELNFMGQGLGDGVEDINSAVGEDLQSHVHGVRKASDNQMLAMVQGVLIGADSK